MNHVTIVGNLVADPVLRFTKSGKAVTNFTVAVNHRSKTNGEWQDVTDGFFNVAAWDQLAEHVTHSCKKGARVLVAGKLMQRTFEAEGTKRQSIEITASAVGPELKFQSVSDGPEAASSPEEVTV